MTISTTGVHLHHLVDHINSLCKQEWKSVSRHDAAKENKDLFVCSYSSFSRNEGIKNRQALFDMNAM
jgi:hypothetical protein